MHALTSTPLLTAQQVAFQLGHSPKTILDKRWRVANGLRAIRVGRRSIRFRPEDVARLLVPEPMPGDGVRR